MSQLVQFDRSRREAAEKCLRKRWWAYEYKGRGIEPLGKESYFQLGTLVHDGIQQALGWEPPTRQFVLTDEELVLGRALVECWRLVRLPVFSEQYEVLEIEREETVQLDGNVEQLVRPDLLVRRKADGCMFTYNLKTARKIDRLWVEQWKYDALTLSEPLAVEQRISEKLSGVIIEGLVKGDTGTEDGRYASPLTWAWRNESGKPHPRGLWSARWEWDDGKHRLGNGWRKRQVWQHYPGGVVEWCRFLLTSDPAILHDSVVTLEPILRNDFEVEGWKRQVVADETNIRSRRLSVEMGGDLEMNFPMSTASGNCIRPSRCPFFPICWEGADPEDEHLFRPRTINHETEMFNGRN